jgi:hypothetical protein
MSSPSATLFGIDAHISLPTPPSPSVESWKSLHEYLDGRKKHDLSCAMDGYRGFPGLLAVLVDVETEDIR